MKELRSWIRRTWSHISLPPLIGIALLALTFQSAIAQNIEHVVAELEPEIHRALVEGKIPSASIALISGDKVIWTGAYGYSNLWARTPATPSTTYLIGSTFKAMSTVALLQQMEQGKFKLDDRVNDYLTEFKIQNEDPKNPVTFRHLFTHTSGLPGGFGGFSVWGDTVPPPLAEYLSKSLVISKSTGSVVIYSNPAYTLIGYLVEKFSGIPYKKYIQENIFAPLEMANTAFEPTPAMDERISMPYTVDEKTGSQVPAVRVKASVWPAGMVYGTVYDQANWMIANLNGGTFKGKRIISENTLEQMFTRQHDRFKGPLEGIWGNETAGFGLTWWSQVRDGDRYFAHSGSVGGYTAFLLGNRDRKFGFAILTNGNRAHSHLFKLADRAMDLMKKHSESAKVAAAHRPETWERPSAQNRLINEIRTTHFRRDAYVSRRAQFVALDCTRTNCGCSVRHRYPERPGARRSRQSVDPRGRCDQGRAVRPNR